MDIQKEQIKDTLESEGFVLNSYNSGEAIFQKENFQIEITDLNEILITEPKEKPKIANRKFVEDVVELYEMGKDIEQILFSLDLPYEEPLKD